MASVAGAVVYPNDNAGNQSAPVKLGTSGGNVKDNNTANTACCIGTLGSLIQRPAGTFFILSNNHVLDRSAQGAPGEAIDQPGEAMCPAGSQGLQVGTLVQGAPLKPASGTTGPSPSNVDAAIASVTGAIDTSDPILDLGAAGATSIAAAPPSSTTVAPSVGLAVAKSGRTTGLTCSTVDAINETVKVDYDSSCGGPVAFTSTFSNQVDVTGGSFSGEGDSGSLIVTSATRQPVALLYAGNTTSTVGNPIGDVLNAFNNGTAPTIVGLPGPQAAVSCAPTASVNSVQVPGSFTPAVLTISEHERARVVAVKEKYEALLAKNPAVVSVDMGASGDSPGEGALVVELSRPSRTGLPAVLDGVRTKVVFSEGVAVPPRELTAQDIGSATSVKEAHVANLMSSPGIQGVGVGRSKDNPDETAIVIFTVTGMPHPDIPPVLDGIRTQVIEGTRFHAR